MKLVTAAQMRGIDHQAIHQYGIPGVVLMETAGNAVARRIVEVLSTAADKKICVFAGKGNNGGDGYVIARFLQSQGARVKVFLVGSRQEVSGDARVNLDVIERMGMEICEIKDTTKWDIIGVAVSFADCLVDALLGTGFNGELQGVMLKTVELINRSGKPVFAVDIPSGVHADTGQIGGSAIKATYTVSLGMLKPGILLYPGAEYAGEVTLAELGIPSAVIAEQEIRCNLLTAATVQRLLPQRTANSHKGMWGRIVVVAGSRGFSGAAALAATGALRAGAGLVTLAAPAGIQGILATKLTEVMTRALPETPGGGLDLTAVEEVRQLAGGADVLALGPGLGTQAETRELVREVLRTVSCPLVLDADALNALVGYTEELAQIEALAVLTPHPGEMARLLRVSIDDVQKDRIGVTQRAASAWNCIVVLKGARTVVAFPDGEVFLNSTGNAGMASGGTGDVLTGVIAALIGQGLSSHDAAVCGVYLHGLAGDIVAQNGMTGLTAGDLAAALPAALHGMKNSDC
ncbi:MAG TPA: NAD(P)H-hydrate dehydratase [Patescibacteria group bacterium]|nr:NAD(P)H-hydrate dehydratase [Patescibacteria group bacterium]